MKTDNTIFVIRAYAFEVKEAQYKRTTADIPAVAIKYNIARAMSYN